MPSSVPRVPGIYAWYFDEALPGVPEAGRHNIEFGTLLYVGISPKEPPKNGKPPSRQTLASRIRYHFGGNAYGSTLRLTLGCHLASALGIELRRVGSGSRLTFTPPGEAVLSRWMGEHARVAILEHPRPWDLEPLLIADLDLPLNIEHNGANSYYATLRDLRSTHRSRARNLPVWTAQST